MCDQVTGNYVNNMKLTLMLSLLLLPLAVQANTEHGLPATKGNLTVNAKQQPWGISPKLDYLNPNVNVNFRFYDLEASGLMELFQKIRMVGPAGKPGNKAAAKASYKMNWQMAMEKTSSLCRIGDATVDIDIEIVVPRWLDVDEQSEKSQGHWQIYLGALLDHESGHKDIVVAAADKLITYIRFQSPTSSCSQLQKKVDQYGFRLLNDAKQKSVQYDRTARLRFK